MLKTVVFERQCQLRLNKTLKKYHCVFRKDSVSTSIKHTMKIPTNKKKPADRLLSIEMSKGQEAESVPFS